MQYRKLVVDGFIECAVQKLDEFHSAVGLVFEGNATEKLCDVIEGKMK